VCDIETKNEEIEQLQQLKSKLIEENNFYIAQCDKLQKNLMAQA